MCEWNPRSSPGEHYSKIPLPIDVRWKQRYSIKLISTCKTIRREKKNWGEEREGSAHRGGSVIHQLSDCYPQAAVAWFGWGPLCIVVTFVIFFNIQMGLLIAYHSILLTLQLGAGFCVFRAKCGLKVRLQLGQVKVLLLFFEISYATFVGRGSVGATCLSAVHCFTCWTMFRILTSDATTYVCRLYIALLFSHSCMNGCLRSMIIREHCLFTPRDRAVITDHTICVAELSESIIWHDTCHTRMCTQLE